MKPNAVLCPHCKQDLYTVAQIGKTPFTTATQKLPKRRSEVNKSFFICPNPKCGKKVFMIAAGRGIRVSPIQKKG